MPGSSITGAATTLAQAITRQYARTMTITSDELVRRNAVFAAGGAFAGLPFPTPQTLQVLGCVDSRVDPAHVLGLDLGEAVVTRNIGGRVTPAVLRSFGLLAKLGQSNPKSVAPPLIRVSSEDERPVSVYATNPHFETPHVATRGVGEWTGSSARCRSCTRDRFV
jgi:Carbonic anhydrase